MGRRHNQQADFQRTVSVALITPSFFPVRGGTEQVAYEVATRMAQQHGHKVIVITPHIKKTPYKERIGNITIYRFPVIRIPVLNMLSSHLILLGVLPWLLKKEKITLMHMYHIYQMGGTVALMRKLFNIPLITCLIGWDTYDPIRPVPCIFWPLLRFVYRNSDRVVTSCQSMLRAAQRQGCRKPILLIPHGTSMNERTAKEGCDVRKKYSIPDTAPVIFSLQRLYPRKGIEYLIRAVPHVLKKHPAAVFLIGGKGPEREKLEALAQELGVGRSVIFAGFIPDDELKNYYEAATVFAMPSLYEGFGVVYVDALLNGVPIVTTRCGGPEDIVTTENGFLVPVRNSEAFADALIQSLKVRWNRKKIGADARRYEWRLVIQSYQKVYQQVMKEEQA